MLKPIVDDEAKRTGLAALHPFKGLGEAEDIAKAAVFLASDDASWVSGTALTVDGKPSLSNLYGTMNLLETRRLHCPLVVYTPQSHMPVPGINQWASISRVLLEHI